jgi:hypothetical protein
MDSHKPFSEVIVGLFPSDSEIVGIKQLWIESVPEVG